MPGRPNPRMPRFAILRMAVAGAAAAGLLTLAACSGAPDSTENTAPEASSSSAPATSAPPSPDAESSEPESSASAPSTPAEDTGSEDSGSKSDAGKPTQDEVAAGLAKWYESDMSIPKASAKIAADCLAAEVYDSMSTKALKSMAEGKLDPASMTADDGQAFATAGSTCAKEIGS